MWWPSSGAALSIAAADHARLGPHSVDHSAAKQLARYRWLTIEWLPAYALELDPVEFFWNHTKYTDLASFG
jgi:transposase